MADLRERLIQQQGSSRSSDEMLARVKKTVRVRRRQSRLLMAVTTFAGAAAVLSWTVMVFLSQTGVVSLEGRFGGAYDPELFQVRLYHVLRYVLWVWIVLGAGSYLVRKRMMQKYQVPEER